MADTGCTACKSREVRNCVKISGVARLIMSVEVIIVGELFAARSLIIIIIIIISPMGSISRFIFRICFQKTTLTTTAFLNEVTEIAFQGYLDEDFLIFNKYLCFE